MISGSTSSVLQCGFGLSLAYALLLFPLVYLFGGLAVYVFRSRVLGTTPVDEEVARRGQSLLLGSTLRQGFAWTAAPVEAGLLALGATPDALSICGCVVCAAGAVVLGAGQPALGGLLILGSSAFDFFDGRIARRLGLSSRGGDFLDSTLDRYSDAFCFGAAAFLLRDRPLPLIAALVAFGAAAVVPYARAKAESLGAELKSGLMQRPERLVVFSAAAILGGVIDPLWPVSMSQGHPTFSSAIGFLAVATTVTAVSRTREGRRRLRDDLRGSR